MAEPDPHRAPPSAGDGLFRDDPARDAVLDEALAEATFDGWTATSLDRAARMAGEAARLPLLFPLGVRDVLDYWAGREDGAAVAAYEALDPKPAGITAGVAWLVRRRIEGLEPNREAARRAAATLALPPYAALGARLTWRTADRIWRALGDDATDFNHYSKRAILSGVYASTAARWFADEAGPAQAGWDAPERPAYQDTWDFLDRRIGDVMRIEKAKARVRAAAPDVSSLVAALGRMRYGDGH